MPNLYAFTCNPVSNGRATWCRIQTLRGANCALHTSNISIELGRRLIQCLADRHNVADRSGLFTGRLIFVGQGEDN